MQNQILEFVTEILIKQSCLEHNLSPNHSHGQNLLLGKHFFQEDYAVTVLVVKRVNKETVVSWR